MRYRACHGAGKKRRLLAELEEYICFRLDFPKVNCRQCEENEKKDGIEPDCDNCKLPVLSPENEELLELYQTINTAFVKDFHALGLVFEIRSIKCTQAEADAMLERLITVHGLVREHEIEEWENKRRQLGRK